MSEIEKMYKNAGINHEERYSNCTLNKEGECKLKCSCAICKYSEEKYIYPPFTAEKQLGLIKLLSIKYSFVSNYVKKYDEYILQVDDFYSTKKDFSNALANLIIVIWQDLTEQERTEIADILKG